MLKRAFSEPWRIWAAVAAVPVLLVAAATARLAAGPVEADWLKGGLERDLAAQVDGGTARVGSVRLAWFDRSGSLGVELSDVALADARGREVLRAGRVHAAVALDSLIGFAPAPGRIAAEDFAAVVSVSPQGKYELGYDAKGEPAEVSSLDKLFADLTGAPRHGRPMSFLRQLELESGALTLREVAGPVAWTADVRALRFDKTEGAVKARADLTIADGEGAPAVIRARARAAVGLDKAYLEGSFSDLRPARVFPSAGVTRPLSALDAVARGRGSLSYDLRQGVQAAELEFDAGEGSLRFGGAREAFQSARARAAYAPETGEVVLHALDLKAEKTRLEAAGRFRLVPEDARRRVPARLEFDLTGPVASVALAADAPAQSLTDVSAKGRYTPELRRIEFDSGRATLGGARAEGRGAIFQDRRGRWGADLEARAPGEIKPEQIFSFWPIPKIEGPTARAWLQTAILGARLSDARFRLKAQPGAFERGVTNEELELTFRFQDADFQFSEDTPPVTQGAGTAVLRGNSFKLALERARLGSVALSEGEVDVTRFEPMNAPAYIRARAVGEARDMLDIVDAAPPHVLRKGGLSTARISGQADVRIEIMRPMRNHVPFEDYRVRYQGVVRRARFADAALGWDLEDGELKVDGDHARVSVDGQGVVGPYRGGLKFAAIFGDDVRKGAKTVEFDGLVRASAFGGRPDMQAPMGGRLRLDGAGGEGTLRGAIFEGRLAWKDENGLATRFNLDGRGDARALRRVGTPFMEGLPDRFPIKADFQRGGDVWRGDVIADALSGRAVYTPGQRARLVYEAELTPIEARRLGFGRMPLFEQVRRVDVDAQWEGTGGAAQIKAGPVDLALSWARPSETAFAEQTLRGQFTREDFAALGLPAVVKPGAALPITAVWRGDGEGTHGVLDVAGTPARFHTGPTPGRPGARTLTVNASLDAQTLRRIGAPDALDFDGVAGVSARWIDDEDAPTAGRVDLDLTQAYVGVPRSEWRKPAGRPARVGVDFVRLNDGALRLSRIWGDGTEIELEGSALLSADGALTALDLTRVRLEGLIDGSLKLGRDGQGPGLALTLRGRWLDARRLFDRLSAEGALAAGGQARAAPPVRVDAELAALRLTDEAVLRQVKAAGVWSETTARRLELTAETSGGAKLRGRLFPQGGVTAVFAETNDAGEVARALFGLKTLRGGRAVLTGRLVDGGADVDLDVRDVRLVRAPTMAQILTMASLQGLADTLNGEGVLFNRVEAPVQVRGRRLIVGDARATGQALGLTTKGVADLKADTLDFEGTIAPAYALNSMVGQVPVLGQLLVSRKGEGVVGLSYAARGSFDKPQIAVNPLSLMTPGILRRIFETPETPSAERATAPSGRDGGR